MWSDTSGTTVLCPLSHIKGKKVVISRKGRKAFSHIKSKGSIQFVLSRWEQGLISRRSLHAPNHPNSWMCYISNLKSSPACIKSNKFWGATEVSLQLLSTIQQAFCWETSKHAAPRRGGDTVITSEPVLSAGKADITQEKGTHTNPRLVVLMLKVEN